MILKIKLSKYKPTVVTWGHSRAIKTQNLILRIVAVAEKLKFQSRISRNWCRSGPGSDNLSSLATSLNPYWQISGIWARPFTWKTHPSKNYEYLFSFFKTRVVSYTVYLENSSNRQLGNASKLIMFLSYVSKLTITRESIDLTKCWCFQCK